MDEMIRVAEIDDLNRIVDIYNSVITEGGFTADRSIYNKKDKIDWFIKLREEESIWVINSDNLVIGYFYLSDWRGGREALLETKEISIYLDRASRDLGIGKQSISYAIKIAKERGLRNLLAILLEMNNRSVALLKKSGFHTVGKLSNVARIDGNTENQLIMQIEL